MSKQKLFLREQSLFPVWQKNPANPLNGRIVSPEIDVENARRQFMASDSLLLNLADIKPAKNLRTDVEMNQELAEQIANGNMAEVYKLRTKSQASKALLDSVLFKIQNVHDYFMAHCEEHNWHDPESIFAAKLPFDRVVFSYDHEFKPVLAVLAESVATIRRHVNVVMEKATGADVLRCIAESLLSEKDGNELAHILDRRQPDSLIKTTLAMDGHPYPGTWFVMIDETGHCLTDPVHQQNWLWIRDPKQTAQIAFIESQVGEAASDAFARHGMICLTAVQFLNCRNVEVLDNPPTRQQRRHAERSGESAPVTYKTLVIHPMGQKRVKTHNDDGTVVHGVALHIVRGHFKSYMAGAGLGRSHTHGVFWWSPAVRGSAERGRVEKDYSVEPK